MSEAAADPRGDGQRVPDADRDDQRAALAAALRRVTTSVVADDVPADALRRAAAAVAAVADTLQAAAGGRLARSLPDPALGAHTFFPTSPVIGRLNPVAPPVRIWTEDGGVAGEAWLDRAYEGPPTCVHGGVIAMLFDELLGAATIVAGRAGMTGTLTIRYRRPTPLRSPLQLRARCTEVHGRKIHAEGVILHDGEVTADARGLFVEMHPERFMAMIARQGADPSTLWPTADGPPGVGGLPTAPS